jgi:Na+/proline symporter
MWGFGSGTLALLVALVGILALLPYMALQMYASCQRSFWGSTLTGSIVSL